ncbi:MAG TPA: MFS transporter [Candidatus Scatomorpha merdigallinarum]|nr:MFS transporter [Candidatus Scatomorpha merdigallinarum]
MLKALKEKLTPVELAWVLYDVGNSAFTMLACSLIPIWFKSLAIGDAPGQLSSDAATGTWALGVSLVTVVVALMGPVCGALSDRRDMKLIFFRTSVFIGVAGCIINGLATGWVLFLVVFIISKVAYSCSLTFYDSMLGDVTTEERMDEVSSYGYAWGYIGSCIPFLVALVFYILGPDMLGVISGFLSKLLGFTVTAVWWLIVTLPLLRRYKQRNYTEPKPHAVRTAFVKLGGTIKRIATQDKKVGWFLLAFFLYIDGVGTIIDNCINIGTDLGLDTVGQVVVLLATQVVAWIFSLVFAKLSRRYSTVKLLSVCIIGYFAVCLYAFTLRTMLQFGIMAFGVGMFQGSIQSLSRSYFTKIIPPENSGEYFGIYDIFSKGASFIGSAVIAAVKFAGGTINIAVGLMAIFFFLGLVLLRVADKKESARV